MAFDGHQNVGGFDVAMNDAAIMRISKTLKDVIGDLERGLQIESDVTSQQRQQGLAVDVLHGEVGDALAGVSDLVEGDDVGMNQRPAQLGFAAETCKKVRLGFGIIEDLMLFLEGLERNVATDPKVACEV